MQPLSARFLAVVSAASMALLTGAAASALTVTLIPGFNPAGQGNVAQAIAFTDSDYIVDEDLPASVPASGSLTATSGSLAEQLDYDLSTAGFDFRGSLAADSLTGSGTFVDLFFQVDEPTRYLISGDFSAANEAGTLVGLWVGLYERLGAALMVSQQQSIDTANEAFLVGGLGGDDRSVMSGSLTGTLMPGQSYHFQVVMDLEEAGAPSSGSGRVTLEFLVPEPASASLMLAGLAALVALRRAR